MSNKYLDETGVSTLWSKVKERDNAIINNATVYGAYRDGAGNVISTYYIPSNQKGANNGVASLGSDGKIPTSQLPSYVDDVIEGYYYNNKFYTTSAHTTEIAGETGKIYIDLATNKSYRYGGTTFVEISSSLVIGTTTGTAYDGGLGTALRNDFDNLENGLTNGNFVVKNAEKATKDGSGNAITTTYAAKTEVTTELAKKVDKTSVGTYSTTLIDYSDEYVEISASYNSTTVKANFTVLAYDTDDVHAKVETYNSSNIYTGIDVSGDDKTIEMTATGGVSVNGNTVLDDSMAITAQELATILV